MRILLTFMFFMAVLNFDASAQQTTARYMQITTVESVVGGGAGRSRMIITKEDGTQDEKDLDNLFSITGINFKNIRGNENIILATIKSYTDAGWKLFSSTPLTLSPSQSGNGIFMTRYLLVKDGKKTEAQNELHASARN